jgi:hypothetical protein
MRSFFNCDPPANREGSCNQDGPDPLFPDNTHLPVTDVRMRPNA